MMIRVMYPDGKTEMVRPPLLRLLLERGRISKFRREEGWAVVGEAPLRRHQNLSYVGPERRRN